jgi:hypothetical protein
VAAFIALAGDEVHGVGERVPHCQQHSKIIMRLALDEF